MAAHGPGFSAVKGWQRGCCGEGTARQPDLQVLAESILKLDAYNYYMMNIIDYLTGNTDRHWGNWGVLVDNEPESVSLALNYFHNAT